MIETAIDLAGDKLAIADVSALLEAGKELLAHPIELLPGAEAAVEAVKARGLHVVLITKGDLFHQESKVARSGFGDLVDARRRRRREGRPDLRPGPPPPRHRPRRRSSWSATRCGRTASRCWSWAAGPPTSPTS